MYMRSGNEALSDQELHTLLTDAALAACVVSGEGTSCAIEGSIIDALGFLLSRHR